ncbi:Uncharacterized conserved protein DUF2156 [Aspergillus sclerotialis]|uniref:Uncharacterized conserved protein DUF2156 n=1 Tax=Aspergillus sclerotialis TaxID=2070753 RepID=A0A3A2ZJ63_9EURO|nr:Uncharacterized conserved protein DUF2156 [Aspergillus sclerotialis]
MDIPPVSTPQHVDDSPELLLPDRARGKPAKQQRRKAKPIKKSMLLDDISDCLVYQFYTHRKLNPCQCCGSLIDRLRSVASNSSTSSGSGSSRTLVDTATSSETLSCKNSSVTCYPSISDVPLDRPAHSAPMKLKYREHANIFCLDDLKTTDTIKQLAADYGRISHMGILDRSYSFFMNEARTAALSFKVQNKVAIVEGEPLCDPDSFDGLLAEFEEYRKRFGWSIAFMGASGAFVDYARERSWTTLQFGRERVLNPMTNDVLLERSGKRMLVQNRQLLDPVKGGITLGLYVPSHEDDLGLQRELISIYDAWRLERNRSSSPQAFITVYDPFSLPDLMTYIYTRGPDGVANGFAALRKIGANQGYHIDPCIAAPDAPRGVSDLLVFAALALLNRAGVSYLSFGYEPLDTLEEITGMARPIEKVTRTLYHHTFQRLPIGGKKAYHDKFRPDQFQESSLYLIFPAAVPSPRQVVAMAHIANVSIRKLVFADDKASANPKAKKSRKPNKEVTDIPDKTSSLGDKMQRLNLSKLSIHSSQRSDGTGIVERAA